MSAGNAVIVLLQPLHSLEAFGPRECLRKPVGAYEWYASNMMHPQPRRVAKGLSCRGKGEPLHACSNERAGTHQKLLEV